MESASAEAVEICGELIGIVRTRPSGRTHAEVVRILKEGRPRGPAENALVLVELLASGQKSSRYISWIGYHDVEEAQVAEPGVWELVEPARSYRCIAQWAPFGWVGMRIIPGHAEVDGRPTP
jgi:hypothetical protein